MILKDIQRIEKIAKCKMLTSVTQEALDENSPLCGERDSLRFTFITAKEHQQLQSFIRDKTASPIPLIPELKIFWMDQDGNYMGIFVAGPMLGRLALVGHDSSIDCAPLYRGLDTFIEAIKVGIKTPDNEWPYQVDYPNTGDELQADASTVDIESDVECLKQVESSAALAQDPFRKRFLNSCIISLTPKQYAARIVPMLNNADYHVCSRACLLLGYYQFDEACGKLVQIAADIRNPARFGAIDGLGLMRTKTSQEALLKLIRDGMQLPGNITTALKRHGLDAFFNKNYSNTGQTIIEWHVRIPKRNISERINIDSFRRPAYWWNFGLKKE